MERIQNTITKLSYIPFPRQSQALALHRLFVYTALAGADALNESTNQQYKQRMADLAIALIPFQLQFDLKIIFVYSSSQIKFILSFYI